MRKRNNRVAVRLSEDEYAFLKAQTRKSGLSQEAYLRVIISGRIPKERPTEPLIKMVRELGAIGNNRPTAHSRTLRENRKKPISTNSRKIAARKTN